jgi:hypothetical protein
MKTIVIENALSRNNQLKNLTVLLLHKYSNYL